MSAIFSIAQYDHHTSWAGGLHLNFTNLCPALSLAWQESA
jgi:hypothetical protein